MKPIPNGAARGQRLEKRLEPLVAELLDLREQMDGSSPIVVVGSTPANGVVSVPLPSPADDVSVHVETGLSAGGRPTSLNRRLIRSGGRIVRVEVVISEIAEAPVKTTVSLVGVAVGATIGKADPVRPASGVEYRIEIVGRSA